MGILKTGLDCVLGEPRGCILGVAKTGLDCALGKPGRCILGVIETGLEEVLELINARRRNVV